MSVQEHCVCMWVRVHVRVVFMNVSQMCVGAPGSQRRALYPLDLELWMAVNHAAWC